MNGKRNSLWTFYSNKHKIFSDIKKMEVGMDGTYESKGAYFFETDLICLLQTNLIELTSNLTLQFLFQKLF